MTIREFCALVKSIKYKPGYKLTAEQDWVNTGSFVRVVLEAPVRDAGNPDEYVTIHQSLWLTTEDIRYFKDEVWPQRIFDFLMAFERHEAGEWFRVGDVKPFDPHRATPVPGEEYARD